MQLRPQYTRVLSHCSANSSAVRSNMSGIQARTACTLHAVHTYGGCNFGPIDPELDQLLHGSARPGPDSQQRFSEDDQIQPEHVQQWARFAKAQGVKRVVGLLNGEEIRIYQTPAVDVLCGEGLTAVNVDVENDGQAMQQLAQQMREAHAAGEKVVLHCWGGSGRTGAAAAACLAAQHGLTVEEAAQRVEAAAQKLGTNRRVNVATAQKLVNQLQQ